MPSERDPQELIRQGAEAYEAGQFHVAIDRWSKARTVWFELGEKEEVATCDRNVGYALAALGQMVPAIEQFERARLVYKDLGLEEEVAICDTMISSATLVGDGAELFRLGEEAANAGRFTEAIDRWSQGRVIGLKLGME